MNKKIIFGMVLILLISSLVVAEIFDDETGGYTWDGSTISDDLICDNNGWDFQGGSATSFKWGTDASDYDGDGFSIDVGSVNEEMTYFNYSWNGSQSDSGELNNVTKWLSIFLYDDSADSSAYTTVAPTNQQLCKIGLYTTQSSTNYIYIDYGIGTTTLGRSTGWHNFSFYWDDANDSITGYIDGNNIIECPQTAETKNKGFTSIRLQASASASCGNCKWDSAYAWNVTTLPPPLVLGTDYINVSNSSPLNYTQYNYTTINFNVSYNSSYTHNVTLYLNGTKINETTGITGIEATELYYEFNYTISTASHYGYYFNVSGGNISESTVTKTFYIDATAPTLDTNFSNNDIFYLDNITGEFNFTDNFMLFSVNFSVEGEQIYYRKELNTSFFWFNLSQDPRDFSIGDHILNVTYADGHTANIIPDYDWGNGLFNDYIKYTFDNKVWVKIKQKDGSILDSWSTEKFTDRYKFYFEPSDDKLNSYTFTVTANQDIDIVNTNSQYKNYLIVDGHWLDFVLDNEEYDITLTRIASNEIEVTLDGLTPSSRFEFNSIGDLNIVTESFYFTVGNITSISSSETELTSLLLEVDFNVTSNISDTNATLVYNNTLYNLTKYDLGNYHRWNATVITPDIDGFSRVINFTWNITAETSSSLVRTFSFDSNHSVSSFLLNYSYSCPGYNYALNFSVLNRSDNVPLTATTESLFRTWITTGYEQNFTFTKGLNITHSYCIYPNETQYGNYEILFQKDGYSDRRYIINNGTLDNITDQINIYLDPNSVTTDITAIVVDENDDELVGYVVGVYQYNLGGDNYSLVDTQTTNGEGSTQFSLDVSSKQYQFRVFNTSGQLIHTEPKQILTDTSYTLRVVLGTDYESILIKLQPLDYTLTADNTKKNFTLTWDDSSTSLINSINLTVYLTNITNTIILYSEISTSDTGTLYYNVSASGTYIASVYVVATENGLSYFLESVALDIKTAYDYFGTDALLMSFLFIAVMFFVGLSVGGEIALIFTIMGMIIFYYLGFIEVSLSGLVNIIISLVLIMTRAKSR